MHRLARTLFLSLALVGLIGALGPTAAIAMLVNRSADGGRTWLATGLTQVSAWNGNGKSRGGNGQFPDHESIHVDMSPTSPFYGSVYVTWAQFDGLKGTHSPVYVAVS